MKRARLLYNCPVPGTTNKIIFVAMAAPALLNLFSPPPSLAVPAAPGVVELTQPDGAKVGVFLRGDEFYHWNEDASGYTVMKNAAGEWVYAEPEPGLPPKAGANKVGTADPASLGIPKHLTDPSRISAAGARRPARDPSSRLTPGAPRSDPQKTPILTGTMRNLVILARFSDQTTTYSRDQFESLFNQVGYTADNSTGSVKDYYLEASYNSLTIQSFVTAWVVLPDSAAHYGANSGGSDQNPRQMVTDALTILNNAGFDFASLDGNGDGAVDGLTLIHSGRGEEFGGNNSDYIWSHQWSLAAPFVTWDSRTLQDYHTEPEVRGWDALPATQGITRVGVICHETGHFLGLPDLYDYGYDSQGAGDFCLMATGSWNGDYGTSPAHPSAWCKKTLGWATASQITVSKAYSLARIEDHSDAMYLLRGSLFPSTEYFLMENRQGFGFDGSLPGTQRGILIWHVDESVSDNNDQTHYLVDLEEADGIQNLALDTGAGSDSDYFRVGISTAFSDSTTPDAKSYTGKMLSFSVSNISATGNPMTFSISGAASDVRTALVYPKPWKPGSRGNHDAAGISFANVADDAEVRVYTLMGELVREFTVEKKDLNIKVWDGKNSAGKDAASGVYFVTIKAPGNPLQTLRLAIER